MASVQQGEKQLFEKFWRGTFKAVATPRPGSIIVASITSRKPLPSSEVPSFPSLSTADKHSEVPHLAHETWRTNGCVRLKGSQESARQKSCSPSCDEDFTPPPARGKKKKKKSTRKKRRRSPSCSPSPVKKKKKKKSSKKRKKNRLSSKKRRHSSSSPKRKRKEDRKHKKHSHSRPRKSQRRHHHHHHHHHSRSGSDSTSSLSESCGSRPRARSQEEGRHARWKHSQRSSTCAPKPDDAPVVTGALFFGHALQNHCGLSTTGVISKSGSSADPAQKEGRLAKRHGEPHEYDSGNDTSSPPSIQTTSSRSQGDREAGGQVYNGLGHPFSSGKTSSGSSSDSGNSFTSCVSRNKGPSLEDPTPSQCVGTKDQSSPIRSCFWNESSASRSSPESGRSRLSRHKGRLRSSQSRSCSSGTRSYSRSPSYSSKSGRKSSGSRSSRPRRSPSYSRYSPSRDRERNHKYGSSGKESHRHRDRRRRNQSYSPLRKRRRDSPSHLEARRITSARKRPIPYYRPSPSTSSSSSVSSYSSWYSSHSPSRSHSRSRSYSSHRTSSSRSRSSSVRSNRRSCGRSSESVGSYDSPRH